MTSLGILQPRAIPGLIPDLPALVLRELRLALTTLDANGRDRSQESPPVTAGLLFLAGALHTSQTWLQQYWTESAEMMADCITAGQGLPVLRGLNVILDMIPD
jgi:hypothetical protein